MEKHLKKLPLALLCLYSLKQLMLSPSINEVATIAVLGAVTVVFHIISIKKEKDDFKEQIEALELELNKTKKIQEEILSGVTQIKLSQGFKSFVNSK